MSTPTKADQIREALEHIVRGTTEEFTATKAQEALSILADLDGGGEVVKYGTTPGLQRNCSGCDFLSTPRESKYFHYCPGCGSGIDPSPTAADAPPEAERRERVDPWISVDDRLPEDSRTVLVRMPNGTPKLAWYMDTSQGQSMWFDPSTDCRMYPVKWMEIPE